MRVYICGMCKTEVRTDGGRPTLQGRCPVCLNCMWGEIEETPKPGDGEFCEFCGSYMAIAGSVRWCERCGG